jgi:hypothetical protein
MYVQNSAAVGTAWSLLGSHRNGKGFRNIYSVRSAFIASVPVDVFETNRKRLVVCTQCLPSDKVTSSPRTNNKYVTIVTNMLPIKFRLSKDYSGPTAVINVLEKRIISRSCQQSNYGMSSPRSSHYTD